MEYFLKFPDPVVIVYDLALTTIKDTANSECVWGRWRNHSRSSNDLLILISNSVSFPILRSETSGLSFGFLWRFDEGGRKSEADR